MHPLKILVGAAVPPDPNAGASGTVYQMNAALRRLGHQVDEIWQADLGRRIRHGNLHYLFELPRAYRREMRRRLRTTVYDVVELNQPHAVLAAIDYRRSHRRGVFVNRSHGHETRSEEALADWRRRLGEPPRAFPRAAAGRVVRRLLDRQWERIAREADGFIVSCSEDADFLARRMHVPTERVGAITQGVPPAYLTREPAPFTPGRGRRLIYVGQLAFFKAPMMLAEAVSRVLAADPQVTMTWVCGREHHAAAGSLLEAAIRDRVAFLDWMPQEQLIDVLDRHGVFLFPSFFEGFGKAPLEAMARGLCAICSHAGGMRDYVTDGVSGVLIPVGQPATMAEAALRLMNDPATCRRMSAAAREVALTHTWDRCARDATDFYRSLLDLKRRPSGRHVRTPTGVAW